MRCELKIPVHAGEILKEELAVRSDSDIDYSDIPELDETFWANAKITPPRVKPTVSLRLSQDVIDFFQAESPKGYTGRMAAVLASYVQAKQARPD